MRVVSTATPSPLLPLPLDTEAQLVFDLLNVLIGVVSTTFPLNQVHFIIFLYRSPKMPLICCFLWFYQTEWIKLYEVINAL